MYNKILSNSNKGAIVERTGDSEDDELYMSYADIMAR